MAPSLGRKLTDAAQRARGRHALKYHIEVIPYFVGDIPKDVKYVCMAWERGSKLFVTDAELVNPNTHAAFFKQYLRQEVTIYMEHNQVQPKEYAFKIQKVEKSAKGEDERKTIGKVKVDLAQFCDGQEDPQPQDLFLQCKPDGKMKVSIKARWLKNAVVDPDAMTEVTQLTDFSQASLAGKEGRRRRSHHRHDDDDDSDEGRGGRHSRHNTEQDLSGFDPVSSSGVPGEDSGDAESAGRTRRKSRRRKQFADEIPEGFEAPEDAPTSPGAQSAPQQQQPGSAKAGTGQQQFAGTGGEAEKANLLGRGAVQASDAPASPVKPAKAGRVELSPVQGPGAGDDEQEQADGGGEESQSRKKKKKRRPRPDGHGDTPGDDNDGDSRRSPRGDSNHRLSRSHGQDSAGGGTVSAASKAGGRASRYDDF